MSKFKISSIKRLSSLGIRVEAAMRPFCEILTRRRLRVLIPEGGAVLAAVVAVLLLVISSSDDTDDDEEEAGIWCDPEITIAKGIEMAAPVAIVTPPPVGNSGAVTGTARMWASPLEAEGAGDEELDDREPVPPRCVVNVKRPSSVRCTR